MKKVIKGAVYDTGKATKLIVGEPVSDEEWSDVLYRTKSGRYFLLKPPPDTESGEYEIEPLSLQEAMNWAAYEVDRERFEEAFEPGDENGERKLSVRITKRAYKMLREMAAERSESMGAVLSSIIEGGGVYCSDDPETQHLLSMPMDAMIDKIYKEKERLAEIINHLEPKTGDSK